MERSYIKDVSEGEKALIKGWIQEIRNVGKIIFLVIRDSSGVLQAVVSAKDNPSMFKIAEKVTKESSVEIEGKIKPAKIKSEEVTRKDIEMDVEGVSILNLSPPLPFELSQNVSEDVRLKYRYLDLRRKEMHNNLFVRAKAFRVMREYLD